MRMTAFAALIAALIAAATTAAPGHAVAAGPDPAPEAVEAACRHYDNRARFTPRDGPDFEPVAAIADACLGARAALDDPKATPRMRRAAGTFLARLVETYAAVRAINRDRAATHLADRGPGRANGPVARSLGATMGLVTRSGEHLIFHAGGVYAALGDWMAAGAAYAMADEAR